jgi:hypothetical protein
MWDKVCQGNGKIARLQIEGKGVAAGKAVECGFANVLVCPSRLRPDFCCSIRDITYHHEGCVWLK